MRDIKQDEHVHISYIALTKIPQMQRKIMLKDHFHFDCDCVKCHSPNDEGGPPRHTCCQEGCQGWLVPSTVDSKISSIQDSGVFITTWSCEACGKEQAY